MSDKDKADSDEVHVQPPNLRAADACQNCMHAEYLKYPANFKCHKFGMQVLGSKICDDYENPF